MMKHKISRNYQPFDDDDDDDIKYGIAETNIEEYDLSSESIELTIDVHKQCFGLARANESNPSIKLIQKEDFELEKKLLFNTNQGLRRYLDGLFGTTSKDTESFECVAKSPDSSRRLPIHIYKVFCDVEQQTTCKIIKEVECNIDRCWKIYDELIEGGDGKPISEQFAHPPEFEKILYDHFQMSLPNMRYGRTYRQQILKYLSGHVSKKSSYGGLFINSKRQILGVQNIRNIWSAPKGGPKSNDNDQWETVKETSSREILEEVKVIDIKNQQQITMENINQYFNLDQCLYLECIVDNYAEGRRVGLYVIHVNEEEIKFELENEKENKCCQWLDFDTIVKNKPENGRDYYYTLRKFVTYLHNHPEVFRN